MKKIFIIITTTILLSNISYAEKVECDLLSPIQKKIYKAYCSSIAKENNKNANKTMDKTKSVMKKGLSKFNTDSTLVDWLKKKSK